MLGFCCLQSLTKPWQVFRCAAFIPRQAFFSAFVPVQSLFFGTSARQLLISCLQSLGQWLGFVAYTVPTIQRIAKASDKATSRRFIGNCADDGAKPFSRTLHSRP